MIKYQWKLQEDSTCLHFIGLLTGRKQILYFKTITSPRVGVALRASKLVMVALRARWKMALRALIVGLFIKKL